MPRSCRTDPTPNATQTSLINEWRRAPLNQLKVDDKNSAIIIAEQVIPAEVGGRWIREIALYDSDGDMIAVANCAPTYKPLLNQGSGRTQVVRMNLVVSSASNVQLKIDPAVVLATREWVTEELAKQDFKHSVLVATTAAITLSGLQAVDGIALQAGARVLVKDQAAAKDNGLYQVVAGGPWTRCPDADTGAKVNPGLFVLVEKGMANADSAWQLVSDAPITLGVSALAFEMAFGRTGVTADTYRSVQVDKYGRVVAASNPSTVAGYGITDVYTKSEVFTKGEVSKAVTDAVAALVGSAPAALDQLNELAAAIGNDPNFAATMVNELSRKATVEQVNAIAGLTAGHVAHFAMSTPPAGWLKRNGAAVSRVTYARLFAVIGTQFGAGDGSTTFNLPDDRGYFDRGWSDGRNVDPGRLLFTDQGSQNIEHAHSGGTSAAGAHSHVTYLTRERITAAMVTTGGNAVLGDEMGDGIAPAISDTAPAHAHTFVTNPSGGNEARPFNRAYLACIKY
ncbi:MULTISPECIES: phage tail-collar fiber domain-containing protein [Pseudomonas]|uniref:phage tail-collar fiber domain-containing protein n=1 Tax=Pseudomonas TaxID=286 RepID=UPI001E478C57|nr:phage tail protein [Pseudomonas parasichuanensis]MCE1114164.1 phage tail protein [Pseudomonas sp. NMI795_08]